MTSCMLLTNSTGWQVNFGGGSKCYSRPLSMWSSSQLVQFWCSADVLTETTRNAFRPQCGALQALGWRPAITSAPSFIVQQLVDKSNNNVHMYNLYYECFASANCRSSWKHRHQWLTQNYDISRLTLHWRCWCHHVNSRQGVLVQDRTQQSHDHAQI